MLTVLDIFQEKPHKFPKRLWRKIFYPPVSGRICNVGLATYLRIETVQDVKGPDWKMIAAYCLDPSGRILMPRGVHCPSNSALRSFVPTEFKRRLFENLTLEVLVNMRMPPAERRLAIYGRESEIIELLPRLAPLIGELRIISRRAYAISHAVSEYIERTGMPVVITDQPDARGCHILLAPDGGARIFEVDKNTLVISPTPPSREQGKLLWVNGIKATIPSMLEEIYSEKYDVDEFVGAFYELGGMRELAQTPPEYAIEHFMRTSPAELAERLDKSCADAYAYSHVSPSIYDE